MNQEQIESDAKGHAAFSKLIPIDGKLELQNSKSLEIIKAKAPNPELKSNYFVLIFPGGGYEFTSYREARQVAKAFALKGFDTGILHYTTKYLEDVFKDGALKGEGIGYAPLVDAAYAMEALRQSEEYCQHKIVVCGFSAGGHLASSISTLYDCEALKQHNFKQNLRPDGAILSYPVICSDLGECHPGSFEVLTGSKDPHDWVKFSSDRNVTENTPPAFLWHTATDETVPVINSVKYAKSMWAKGNIAELLVFPVGRHGSSLNTGDVEPTGDFELKDEHRASWLNQAVDFVKNFV